MLKAALYARVSSEEQAKRENNCSEKDYRKSVGE